MNKEKEPAIKVKTIGTLHAESLRYRLTSDTMINLTRSKAFEILEFDTFSGERPVREYWVQQLYNEWLAGRFLWHQAMVAYGTILEKGEDGVMKPHTFRLNGQHTCWMRVNIPPDKEPKSPCKVRQLIYECSDMEGLREIYSVIDRNAARSNAHVTKVLMTDTAACAGIPMSQLNNLTSGFKLWQWEGQWDRHFKGNPQEVSALLSGKYSDLFRIVGTYFQVKYGEWTHLRRAGIVAALFATFDKAGGNAPNFWDQVCSGLNFASKTDPRYQLRQFCEEHSHNIGGQKQVVSPEDLYRIAINLWNKWIKGEAVSIVRTTDTRTKPLSK